MEASMIDDVELYGVARTVLTSLPTDEEFNVSKFSISGWVLCGRRGVIKLVVLEGIRRIRFSRRNQVFEVPLDESEP